MWPSSGYVTADDGIRLYFETRGSGSKPLVLANGIHLLDDFAPLTDGHTLVAFDFANRGRSDRIEDAVGLARGVDNDIRHIEAIRRHFAIPAMDVIGHSYVGLVVALYAMSYAKHVRRVVQIGPMAPSLKQYPAHLSNEDETLRSVFAGLAKLQHERQTSDPVEFCRKAWTLLGQIYVTNPADAHRITWGRCELANERDFMTHWTGVILPSIQKLNVPAEMSRASAPILVIHGTKDRSAPYGGGRDWALMLPNARLVSVEGAGHAPWIEAPELVFDSIKTFFDKGWPEIARKVSALEPTRDEPQ